MVRLIEIIGAHSSLIEHIVVLPDKNIFPLNILVIILVGHIHIILIEPTINLCIVKTFLLKPRSLVQSVIIK